MNEIFYQAFVDELEKQSIAPLTAIEKSARFRWKLKGKAMNNAATHSKKIRKKWIKKVPPHTGTVGSAIDFDAAVSKANLGEVRSLGRRAGREAERGALRQIAKGKRNLAIGVASGGAGLATLPFIRKKKK